MKRVTLAYENVINGHDKIWYAVFEVMRFFTHSQVGNASARGGECEANPKKKQNPPRLILFRVGGKRKKKKK